MPEAAAWNVQAASPTYEFRNEGTSWDFCEQVLEPVLKIRAGAIAEAALVIQARDVDRAEPWPDGQDRQEDQALPV